MLKNQLSDDERKIAQAEYELVKVHLQTLAKTNANTEDALRSAKEELRGVRKELKSIMRSRRWRLAEMALRALGRKPYKSPPLSEHKKRGKDWTAARPVPALSPSTRVSFVEKRPSAFLTAIVGAYDDLHQPRIVDLDSDYILVTDTPMKDGGIWSQRTIDYSHADPTRMARFVKTHPHLFAREHKRVIWMDGSLEVNATAEQLVHPELADCDIITWIHHQRRCVYQEALACIENERDDAATIRKHVEMLRSTGYPENAGLAETSVIVFQHWRPVLMDFLAAWWSLVDNGSKRDQLSFNPAARQFPDLKIGYLGPLGIHMKNDDRFAHTKHAARRKLAGAQS